MNPEGPGGAYTLSESFISRISSLQNLTELSLIWQGSCVIDFTSLVKLFLLPSIRVLYLSDIAFSEEYGTDYGDEDIIPHVPAEVRRKSGVRDLILDFVCVESGLLTALLQLPAALEKFAYGFICEGIYHKNVSAGRFYDLLYPHRNTLKELDVIGCRDSRTATPFPGPCAKQVLIDFPILKKLGCPAEILKARWIEDEQL